MMVSTTVTAALGIFLMGVLVVVRWLNVVLVMVWWCWRGGANYGGGDKG